MSAPTKHGFGRKLLATASTVIIAAAILIVANVEPSLAIDAYSEPDFPAEFTACLGDAIADRGFTDVPDGHTFEESINCMAYYGITVGTGDGSTFSPGQFVPRWQMAVFLSRAMNVAEISAPVRATDDFGVRRTFDDTSGWSVEVQDAVHQVVSNGVMTPRSESSFDPSGTVTRADMAMFLSNMVALASDDVEKRNGVFLLGPMKSPPDDAFQDAIRTHTTAENHGISAAYELGITKGVRDGTVFNGSGSVTRGQMATFIIRALGHSTLRPAGVTVQASGPDVVVSVRDDDFAPVSNAPVDVFFVETDTRHTAFRSNGTCTNQTFRLLGTRTCAIDSNDPLTGADGDYLLNRLSPQDVRSGITVYSWTGPRGRTVFSDTDLQSVEVTLSNLVVEEIGFAKITDDRPEGAVVSRFGSTVTFTLQLRGTRADDVEVDVGPGRSAIDYTITKRLYRGKNAIPPPISETTEVLRAARDGSLEIAVSTVDPDPRRRGNGMVVRLEVSREARNYLGNDSLVPGASAFSTQLRTEDGVSRYITSWYSNVVFTDETPRAQYMDAVVDSYGLAPRGGEAQVNTVHAVLRDQYGDPLVGANVELTSGYADEVVGNGVTGDDGIASIPYEYKGPAGMEALSLSHDRGTTSRNDDLFASTTAYWVELARPSQDINEPNVSFSDPDDGAIVVDMLASSSAVDTTPQLVNYDDNDQFFLDGSPVTLAKFEEEMVKALEERRACQRVRSGIETSNFIESGDINTPTPLPILPLLSLSWESYDYRDPADTAVWKLLIYPSSNC